MPPDINQPTPPVIEMKPLKEVHHTSVPVISLILLVCAGAGIYLAQEASRVDAPAKESPTESVELIPADQSDDSDDAAIKKAVFVGTPPSEEEYRHDRILPEGVHYAQYFIGEDKAFDASQLQMKRADLNGDGVDEVVAVTYPEFPVHRADFASGTSWKGSPPEHEGATGIVEELEIYPVLEEHQRWDIELNGVAFVVFTWDGLIEKWRYELIRVGTGFNDWSATVEAADLDNDGRDEVLAWMEYPGNGWMPESFVIAEKEGKIQRIPYPPFLPVNIVNDDVDGVPAEWRTNCHVGQDAIDYPEDTAKCREAEELATVSIGSGSYSVESLEIRKGQIYMIFNRSWYSMAQKFGGYRVMRILPYDFNQEIGWSPLARDSKLCILDLRPESIKGTYEDQIDACIDAIAG
jgi:hypothetical protein